MLPTLLLATDAGEQLSDATIYIGDRAEIVTRMEQAAADLDRAYARAEAEATRLSTDAARIRATLEAPWEHARPERLMELALAESEGLDIEAIIKAGQAIEEQGVDLAQIRVQLPPRPSATTSVAMTAAPLPQHQPEAVRATTASASVAPSESISLSAFADPRPIARPTLNVATLDLTGMATEAARKRAELARRKRAQALAAGQSSFLDG